MGTALASVFGCDQSPRVDRSSIEIVQGFVSIDPHHSACSSEN
jgi:hypothetical protein